VGGVEDRIRAFYDTWVEQDLEAALDLFAEDAVLEQPDYALDGGERHGRQQLGAAFRTLFEQFEYDGVEIHQIEEGPRGTLATVTARGCGRASGVPIEQHLAHVFELENGLIARLAWYRDRAEGAERAGLG
jgi:ketosteroid isomerase-like protein